MFHVLFFLTWLQVSRVSNPLQTPLAFVILFGTQLLALTEDGARMLIWEVSTNGALFNRSPRVYVS